MPQQRLIDEITIVAGLGSAISGYAQSCGIDIGPIAKSLGIDPEILQSLTARVSLDRLCRLLETCATLVDDDTFGLQCAGFLTPGATGPFGYGLMSAPTVRDYLKFVDDHLYYASNASDTQLEFGDKFASISWTFAPVIAKRDQYTDMSLAMAFNRLRQIIGDETDGLLVELERPKPRNTSLFKKAFSKHIEYSRRINRVHVPNQLLDVANPNGDIRLFTLMDLQCRAMRPEISALSDQHFVSQVRRYMQMRMNEHDISLEDISPYFSLSPRTFQRRLAEAGTNLNTLRDEVRREASHTLLTESELPIADICYRLGYSAPSAFSRSVSRWFGMTPKALRDSTSRNY